MAACPELSPGSLSRVWPWLHLMSSVRMTSHHRSLVLPASAEGLPDDPDEDSDREPDDDVHRGEPDREVAQADGDIGAALARWAAAVAAASTGLRLRRWPWRHLASW